MAISRDPSAGLIPDVLPAVAPSPSEELALPSYQGFGPAASDRLSRERMIDVMERYLTYYAAGKGHTARAKRYDLQHFLEFLAGRKDRVEHVTIEDWTLQKTKDFVEDRLAQGEAPTTVSRRLATIKHFGRTLAERVPGYINPAREAKSPTIQTTRPHGLNAEEISFLRLAAKSAVAKDGDSFAPLRNRFLLELLLATGLRADEVRLLFVSQINDDLSWLKNVKTKGKRFRNVYIDSDIRDLTEEYLALRERELKSRFPLITQLSASELGRFPVLISFYSASISDASSFGLSSKSIWRIIADFGTKAQALSENKLSRLHPHKLRHTFAHGLLDSSKDVRLVAQALGHSDVRTTMRYTERTEDELASAIEAKRKHVR